MNGYKAGLLTCLIFDVFPAHIPVTFCQKRIAKLTAAETVPDLHRIPFSSLSKYDGWLTLKAKVRRKELHFFIRDKFKNAAKRPDIYLVTSI